jgi:hypothetical protein
MEELGVAVTAQELELRSVHHSRNEGRSDHVIVYAVTAADLPTASSSDEIKKVVVARAGDIPEDCSPATKRRIAEFRDSKHSTEAW